MKQYMNEIVTVFESGTVQINHEIKLFGFRVYLDLEFQFEMELDFQLHFRVDKDRVEDVDWPYWETPILFLGFDPFAEGEICGDVDGNLFRLPKEHRNPTLSFRVGKRWILSK